MKNNSIRWATLVVAVFTLAVLGALAVWGKALGLSEESHTGVLAFLGSVGAMALSYMKSFVNSEKLGLTDEEETDE